MQVTPEQLLDGNPEMRAVLEELVPALQEQFEVDVLHALADYKAVHPDEEVDRLHVKKVVDKVQKMRFDLAIVEVWDEGLFRLAWSDEREDLLIVPCAGEASSPLDLVPEARDIYDSFGPDSE